MNHKKTECQFDAYCKKLLFHQAANAHKARHRRTARAVPLSSLSKRELDGLCHYDDYKLDVQYFTVEGQEIEIRNEQLYEALRQLSGCQRNILLLAYCFERTDAEIAALMNIPRSTVQYRRVSAMEYIRKQLEVSTK